MGNVKKIYEGYFSVIIPDNLKKILNGDILKLRDAVTEFSAFLGKYGETSSEVYESFCDEKDPTSWIYYHSLAFAFPDNKIMVCIKSENEKLFSEMQNGIVNGSLKIYLKGVVTLLKCDMEGADENIKKITIKKIESYWEGKPHSSSPTVDDFINTNDVKIKPFKISDLPITNIPNEDDYLIIDDKKDSLILTDYVYSSKNFGWGSLHDNPFLKEVLKKSKNILG